MKSYNSLNQSGNHSPKIYYDEQKSMINQNIKSLDNNYYLFLVSPNFH